MNIFPAKFIPTVWRAILILIWVTLPITQNCYRYSYDDTHPLRVNVLNTWLMIFHKSTVLSHAYYGFIPFLWATLSFIPRYLQNSWCLECCQSFKIRPSTNHLIFTLANLTDNSNSTRRGGMSSHLTFHVLQVIRVVHKAMQRVLTKGESR